MSEASQVQFGSGAPDSLKITVLGRQFPDSTDYWDGNWLVALVSVNVGGFCGSVRGYIRTDEIFEFARQLQTLNKSLSGSALFVTTETWVEIRLTATNKLGTIGLSGFLFESPNRLEFGLELDQTYLTAPLKQLQRVSELFPVVGKP